MLITGKQTADIIGCSTEHVLSLTKRGLLTPVNQRSEGAQKFFRLYDLKAVQDFRKAYVPSATRGPYRKTLAKMNGHDSDPMLPLAPAPPGGQGPLAILRRLDALEAKLDQLIALWS